LEAGAKLSFVLEKNSKKNRIFIFYKVRYLLI